MSSSHSDPVHALGYPLTFDVDRGRFAKTLDYDRYVRGLVLQTLLSATAERINRPEFGTSLPLLVFAAITDEVAELVKAQMHRAMERWLDKLVRVERIETRRPELTRFEIEVRYIVLATGTSDVLSKSFTQ